MDKEKILLITGGSDPMGTEIDGTHDSEYNRRHSFAGRLTDTGRIFQDYTPVNICAGGISNSFILRNTLLWFEKNYDPETQDVFCVVGWTDSSRWETPLENSSDMKPLWPCGDWLAKENDDYLGINIGWAHEEREDFPEQERMHKVYYDFIVNSPPQQMELTSLNIALQLQWFFKSKNIPYLMTDTLHNVKTDQVFVDPYLNMVDKLRYINFGQPEESFYSIYEKLGYTNPKAKYFHHGEDAHLHYSHLLEDHIIKHNLL